MPGMVVHAYNPGTHEVKIGGFQFQVNPGKKFRDTLFKTNKQTNKKTKQAKHGSTCTCDINYSVG
jgi:hypothetical protein